MIINMFEYTYMKKNISYMEKTSYVPGLERGLSVIELLSEEPYEMSFSEISTKLNIPGASLWRILRVLTDRDYIIFDNKRRTYRLGFKIMSMGNFLLETSHFRSIIRDDLKRLAEVTGETVELDVRIRDQLVLIEQVIGPEGLYLYSHPGSAMPYFHATAPGKVYLAQLPAQKLRTVIKKLGLPKLTAKTIQSLDELEKDLNNVRKRGFAVDIEEMREGVARISSPIMDTSGKIMACITVVCPAFRLKDKKRLKKYADHIKKTAEEISFRYDRIF